jgi:hypothetical protein
VGCGINGTDPGSFSSIAARPSKLCIARLSMPPAGPQAQGWTGKCKSIHCQCWVEVGGSSSRHRPGQVLADLAPRAKVVQTAVCSTFTRGAKPATRRVADGERMNPREGWRVRANTRDDEHQGDEHQGDEHLESGPRGHRCPQGTITRDRNLRQKQGRAQRPRLADCEGSGRPVALSWSRQS